MTVKRHVSWPIRLALWLVGGGLAAFAGIMVWQSTVGAGAQERERLGTELKDAQLGLAKERREKAELSELAKTADSRVQIERSAAEKFSQQARTLEQENARLKSELAYLESLLPSKTGGEQPGLALRQFEVSADAVPGAFRYRALLVQGGRDQKEFLGTSQLVVHGQMTGLNKSETLTFPMPHDKAMTERMQIKFQRALRLEGMLELPKGFQPRSMQLRVLEQGNLRVQAQVAL
jgi:hypothetical protein